MLIVSYDFERNKPRSIFAKFLKKFGFRIQYSVFKIKNSQKILNNILKEIELNYKKQFKKSDSIIIFPLCESCRKKIVQYGSASNNEEDIIVFR